MSAKLAELAAGVAVVKKELDGLDEDIRGLLQACAALQRSLTQQNTEQDQLRAQAKAVEAQAAQAGSEVADLRSLLHNVQEQAAALNDQRIELEVGSSWSRGKAFRRYLLLGLTRGGDTPQIVACLPTFASQVA